MPVEDSTTLMAAAYPYSVICRTNKSSFGSCFPDNPRIQLLCNQPEIEQLVYGRSLTIARTLQELETALLGPNFDDDQLEDAAIPLYSCASGFSQDMSWSDSIQASVFEATHASAAQVQSYNWSSPLGNFVEAGCRREVMNPHVVVVRANSNSNKTSTLTNSASTQQQQEQLTTSASTNYCLDKLLLLCAEAVSNEDHDAAHSVITKLNQVVSIYGDPMQRLAAYTVEGLVAKLESSGKGLYTALKCKEPPVGDLLSAMQIMYEVCPYFKFGYMAANGAIAEAFKDEDRLHIIDFEIGQGTQWISLIQALSARPGGAPHVRITCVEDSQVSSRLLQTVRHRLANLADSVKVPLEFHPLAMKLSELQPWMFEVKPGEAVAVNFALQLHHMPDESVCITNPRDRLLRMVKSLNPKVVTVVEQEANTNTAPFLARFTEILSYYSAVFESLDITLPRESRDRVNVEQQCLARDIVNIIACEGADRVERHEVLGKWRARMSMAGFQPYPLSSYVNATIKSLLESYSEKYRLQEQDGALFLGWLNRMLIVASAWH